MNDNVPILLTNESLLPRAAVEGGYPRLRAMNNKYRMKRILKGIIGVIPLLPFLVGCIVLFPMSLLFEWACDHWSWSNDAREWIAEQLEG